MPQVSSDASKHGKEGNAIKHGKEGNAMTFQYLVRISSIMLQLCANFSALVVLCLYNQYKYT